MANHDKSGKSGHKGPERRKLGRRSVPDRRKDVRWEPDKTNRRQAVGRRAIDHLGVLGPKR